MVDLEKYKVKGTDQVYYVPNFIDEHQEKFYSDKIKKAPKTKWVQLANRRLQNWGGQPKPNGMIIEPLPMWMASVCETVSFPELFETKKPNHVLVNEYEPGQGIMPHTDGPLYHPVVCTISLGSHTVLGINNKDRPSDKQYLLLERRSLVILTKDVYTQCLHSIDERTSDLISSEFANISLVKCNEILHKLPIENEVELHRGTRISITIRHVLKTVKLKLKF